MIHTVHHIDLIIITHLGKFKNIQTKHIDTQEKIQIELKNK